MSDNTNKFLTASDLLKNPMSFSGDFIGGFNSRLFGDSYQETCGYPHPSHVVGSRASGWEAANRMINNGKIFYRHIFTHDCKGVSFNYGGTHVCNTCGRRDINKNWWIIKIVKDGDMFMVMGEGFKNLQESNNYAFGETKEQALMNYQKLMETTQPPKGGE